MKVIIDIKSEDVMALLMAGTNDDPILLPYGKAIADEVARRLSLDPMELEQMRVSYAAAGEAMTTLGSLVAEALRDFDERQSSDESPSEGDEEVDSDP